MIGQKGVPATHGGVERHVQELATRLVGMGHEVVVFTRPNYSNPSEVDFRGVTLKSLPTIGSKHLDAIVHSLICTFYCWGGGFDVVHYHAAGPTLASPLARLRGRAAVSTIHGQDWRRGKWGGFASGMLRFAEWVALRVPNATICVSESLAEQLRRESGRQVAYIPNGVSIDPGDDTSVLQEFGIEDRHYLLFAGRLVPEKGLHYLLRAMGSVATQAILVVAGGTSMSDEYIAELKALAGDNVVFVGYQYGARLAALFRHADLFVLPSDVEGLPIVLLEAMAYGAPVLASDIAPNVEVLGNQGEYFRAGDVEDLARRLRDLEGARDRLRSNAAALKAGALAEYDWDVVARETEDVYRSIRPNA